MVFAQIVLLLVIIVLAGILIVLGIQVYYILQEFQVTVQKINKILDDAGSMTESLSSSVASLSSLTESIKTGTAFLSIFKGWNFFKGKKKGHPHAEE